MGERIEYAVDAGVATIRLARPEARNAMDMLLKRELAVAVREASEDPEVRAVIVTGTGGAFCSGGDIEEMAQNDNPVNSRSRLRTLLADVFIPLAGMEKPTIASVNGHAHGSGLSLALACDLMIVSEDAVLSCAFAKMGLVADCGSLYFLPRRLPMPVVKELIFTGRRLGAKEAVEIGLANRAVPAAALAQETMALAREVAAMPTTALGIAKTLLARSHQLGLHDMSELEPFAAAVAYSTSDHHAAAAAFAAKSAPVFTGR